MGEKALWPMVAVVALVCAMLTAIVLSGVDPVAFLAIIGALFMGIGSLVGIVLYGKVAKVEQSTNGNIAEQNATIRDLIDYLKHSTFVEK